MNVKSFVAIGYVDKNIFAQMKLLYDEIRKTIKFLK